MSEKTPAIETEDYKEEVLKSLDNKQKTAKNQKQGSNEFADKWNMNNRIIKLFEDNITKDREMRQIYAKILVGILIIDLIALIVIFILNGCNILNYSDTTFNIFVTGGIAEVFVLVKIIIEYLFKDNLTDALKIILKSNNQVKYKTKENINNQDNM